jgi:DNA-damage-inducible protein D
MKSTNAHGAEYWHAREIMAQLGYKQWRRFENAIRKAITSCAQSGNDPSHHFASAGKPVTGGSGSIQVVPDFHLSRFACYLIAQNGDPRKPEVATAQKYFAIQARRQELSDQLLADRERLGLREDIRREHKELSGAARQAGVQDRMFGVFYDAGYRGLYGGLNLAAIKARKRIPPKEDLLDRIDATELAANNFVHTQTKEKLATVNGQQAAIQVHNDVGRKVRQTIKDIHGVMPEDRDAVEHIKNVRKRVESAVPKIKLADCHAHGLGPRRPQQNLDDL